MTMNIHHITNILDHQVRPAAKPAGYEYKASLRRLGFVLAPLCLAMLALTGCGFGSQPKQGPPASWANQLALAQQEAHKVDKDALLYEVIGDGYDNSPKDFDYDKSMNVRFHFARPNGRAIEVIIEDTNPPVTVKTNASYEEVGRPLSLTEQQGYTNALATVKLGPREVYHKTLSEGLEFPNGPRLSLHYLQLTEHQQIVPESNLGVPMAWGLLYSDITISNSRGIAVLVDPQDGHILTRYELPSN